MNDTDFWLHDAPFIPHFGIGHAPPKGDVHSVPSLNLNWFLKFHHFIVYLLFYFILFQFPNICYLFTYVNWEKYREPTHHVSRMSTWFCADHHPFVQIAGEVTSKPGQDAILRALKPQNFIPSIIDFILFVWMLKRE